MYFCDQKRPTNLKLNGMCTITLEYNPNNALARRKLADLLATGLFAKTEGGPAEATEEEVKAHRKEVQEFLYGSKVLAAKAFAKRL